MTARRSSTCVSSDGTGTVRSDAPVPRLSKWTYRLKLPRRSKQWRYRAHLHHTTAPSAGSEDRPKLMSHHRMGDLRRAGEHRTVSQNARPDRMARVAPIAG